MRVHRNLAVSGMLILSSWSSSPAHPLGQAAPDVELRQSANSSPGEIYPSIVDVPSPGCWVFTLRWNGHEDTIELPYR